MELKIGSKGDSVKDVQQKLNAIGINVGSADGIFGAKTEAGVKTFQALKILPVSGVVDYATLNKLNSSKASEISSSMTMKQKIMNQITLIKGNKKLLAGTGLLVFGVGFLIYRKVKK